MASIYNDKIPEINCSVFEDSDGAFEIAKSEAIN